ncbi:MAG TPA: cupredoxin domain-containing protein [Dehalococcoidia bacterium]|nr:cupredoxin domain-containing protein [Dehalococcoidia bacterium]
MRFEVRAANLAFNTTHLHVRAGTQVTAVFQNDDASVPHNLSFNVPGLEHGETCTGPCTVSQTFTAPAPGRYQFFCTIHPMVGDFIVDP